MTDPQQTRQRAELVERVAGIVAVEREGAPATMELRMAELSLACRDAAAMERALDRPFRESADDAMRRWPESTREYLAQQLRGVHGP